MSWEEIFSPVPAIVVIVIMIVGVIACIASEFSPARVMVHDACLSTTKKYILPDGYRYGNSTIVITGDVATVTATFVKRGKR